MIMCGLLLTTSLLAADQSAPSAELLEFLAESTTEGKDWIDPLTMQEMDDSGTPATTPAAAPTSRGKQP